jgi:glycerate kinase
LGVVREHVSLMAPLPVLVAPVAFGRDLPSAEVAAAIARGLRAGGQPAVELPLPDGGREVLDAVGFDAAMRAARYVVTGEARIDEQTLAGNVVGELATRCRQGGVACHAVVAEEALDVFGERVLDIGSVRSAATLEELERAGRDLAELLTPPRAP